MIGTDPGSKSCWHIPTAALHEGMNQSAMALQIANIKRLLGVGYVESIDVEYVQGDELTQQLDDMSSIDVIWADLGNTYALMHHLRESGGDEHIRQAMDAGAIYIGVSAGSICAGRTVQTAFWKNWDDRTAGGTISVDWDDSDLAQGLDLCSGRSIFPHADGQYADIDWQEEQAEQYGHTDHEVVKIPNGCAYVVDGDQCYML